MTCVSVIIPVYNAEPFLNKTVRSVLSQTFNDLECIIVDDGSSDQSIDVVEPYTGNDPRVRVIRQVNAGPSIARNRGLAAANPSARYLMFLDHDDILEPDAVQVLVEALERDVGAAGAHGLVCFIDATDCLVDLGQAEYRTSHRFDLRGGRVVRRRREDPTTFECLLLRDVLFTPGNLLVRRGVVERVGAFDPGLSWNADWEFALRVASVSHLAFTDRLVVRYRKQARGMSQRPDAAEACERERQRTIRKLSASSLLTETQRRSVGIADRQADVVDSRTAAGAAWIAFRNREPSSAARHLTWAIVARIKAPLRGALSRVGLMTRRSSL